MRNSINNVHLMLCRRFATIFSLTRSYRRIRRGTSLVCCRMRRRWCSPAFELLLDTGSCCRMRSTATCHPIRGSSLSAVDGRQEALARVPLRRADGPWPSLQGAGGVRHGGRVEHSREVLRVPKQLQRGVRRRWLRFHLRRQHP